MQPELRRYIQHVSLSPDSINNDDVGALFFLEQYLDIDSRRQLFSLAHAVNVTLLQAVAPLMKYLQDTMVILTDNLVKENLTR